MNLYNSAMQTAVRMSFIWRVVFFLIFPPLAVFDKGCFPIALVFFVMLLTGVGSVIVLGPFALPVPWIAAALVALLICSADRGGDETQQGIPMQLTGGDILGLGLRCLICCFLCPPLAVVDKGCGAVLLVTLFTLAGGIPGIILALLICLKSNNYYIKNNNPAEGTPADRTERADRDDAKSDDPAGEKPTDRTERTDRDDTKTSDKNNNPAEEKHE